MSVARRRGRTWGWCGAIWLAVSLAPFRLALAGSEPVPDIDTLASTPQVLYLDVVVNEVATHETIQVALRDGDLFVASDVLTRLGVPDIPPGRELALGRIPRLLARYEQETQRLKLTLPMDWFPIQRVQLGPRGIAYTPAQGSPGAVFTYDAYASDGSDTSPSLRVWTETRVFAPRLGVIASTGLWHRDASHGGGSRIDRQGYLRYDTFWERVDDSARSRLVVGDFIGGALNWTRAARMGGVQFARDFSVRPDLVTYPLPEFDGQALVPTSVDLYVGNYQLSRRELQPGPFTLSTQPFINGAGEMTVVTRDVLGREMRATVPFYVSNALLQRDLSDWSLNLGKLRERYGQASFDYGPWVGTASWRRGMTDTFTLEAHAEFARALRVAGAGAVTRLGRFGVLSASAMYGRHDAGPLADHDGTDRAVVLGGKGGWQYRLGYDYTNRRFGFFAQQERTHGDFADVAALVPSHGSPYERRTTRYGIAGGLPRSGTLSLTYLDIRGEGGDGRERKRLANLSWGRSIGNSRSLYLSVNRDMESGDMAAALSVMVPLGARAYADGSLQREADGDVSARLSYSRPVPVDRGIGWNVGASFGDQTAVQAALGWRNGWSRGEIGAYDGSGPGYRWASVGGSLAAMGGGVFFSPPIHNSFAVVDTGYPGIPVLYENQLIGHTNARGHLLVPTVTAYNRIKLNIDPLDLPANIASPVTEVYVAVPSRAGSLVEMRVAEVRAANVRLVGLDGKPVARGARVVNSADGAETIVGWDGLVFLENLADQNELDIAPPDGAPCRAHFAWSDPGDQSLPTLGPIVCTP